MDNQTVAVIGLACTLFGALLAFLSFNRGRDKDVKDDASKEASKNAVIETKLDNIGQAVDSIRIDFKASEQRWNTLSEKVIRIDESTKQAHKRIDEIVTKGEIRNE